MVVIDLYRLHWTGSVGVGGIVAGAEEEEEV